jgi:hypothetical protein
LLAESLVVLSSIAAYAEAANRCTKMSHSVYLPCNGLVTRIRPIVVLAERVANAEKGRADQFLRKALACTLPTFVKNTEK